MVFTYFKTARRRKLLAQAFPEAWLATLERNVGHYRLLPAALQARLRDKLRILVAEMQWDGAKGFSVTDEMKVTVAAQAALLLLGNDDYYFERVTNVVLHGEAFIRKTRSRAMTSPFETPQLQSEVTRLLGEAWGEGSIVLSWPDVLSGGRDPRDGDNLVLHELAHHLDGLDGDMGGSPPMPGDQRQTWDQLCRQAMDQTADDFAAGKPTVFDPYGLTNRAEFFAVATECFFERPMPFRERFAELYAAFERFYRVDPLEWFAERTGQRFRPPAVAGPTAAPGPPRPADLVPLPLPPLETADRYFTRGLELFEDGHFAQAEHDFNRAVRLRPDDQEAILYRAQCRLFLGHDEAALADAQRACRLDPDDSEALRVRGMCHVSLADFERGLQDINSSERLEELNADAHFYRGVAYSELQQWRRAIDDFSRVLKLDPSDAEAYRERSRCHEMLGDRAAAERDREQLRRLGPEDTREDRSRLHP
jgi:Mlc titration factor MtfA (ptsG expression regulator)/Flp pilus assembly protein TadD